MPALHTLLAVALAAAVLNALPGPSQLYVVTRTVALGRRAGLASALGLASGATVHVVLAATGLVALMRAMPVAFDLVRLAGAAYIVWLGVTTLLGHDDDRTGGGPTRAVSARRLWRQGLLTELLNPKTALFFLAFLPPFLDPAAPHPWLQMLVLGLLVPATALPIDLVIATTAAAAAGRLSASPTTRRLRRWLAGSVLVALGAWLVAEEA